MGLTFGAGAMVDLNRNYPASPAQEKGRQKTVHMVEIWELQKSSTGKKLDATTCIRCAVLKYELAETIGNT